MEETKREKCECKNCGSEAEMVITCTLAEDDAADQPSAAPAPAEPKKTKMRKKQTVTCTHCGNEAEMWLDE